MQAIIDSLTKQLADVQQAIRQLDVARDEQTMTALRAKTEAPDFWQHPEDAAAISRQLAALEKHVRSWRELETRIHDALELARLQSETGAQDEATEAQLASEATATETELAAKQFELQLSGPYDRDNCVLSLAAGTGGTDAQDWTSMLLRMYVRYAERVGLTATLLAESPGEEAGLKSASLELSGPYAYGKLRGEQGVHRLVRLSPFNSDNLRQTSFALVEVIPELEQTELEIDPADLRIDVYRAGGHGGQSVNTTDSAVRITHIPTGIVVAIQNERSQLQNKQKAMEVLKGRLAVLMAEQHEAELKQLKGPSKSAAWGDQIRSYVLHPYTKVKDHRTGHETSQAKDVLDGELEPFIEAYLVQGMGKA